jgi:L-fuculose-phosphate aldolase
MSTNFHSVNKRFHARSSGLGERRNGLQGVDFMIRQLAVMIGRRRPIETDAKYRREICKVGRWMYQQGFVVASEGNLSTRLDANRILVTPTGMCKGRLSPHELIITDIEGRVISGTGRPSSEIQMHLLYYRLRPDVRAVCHAHPSTATGFAAAGRALEEAVLPEVVTSLGKIPLAPYGTPGTLEICEALESLVPSYDAVLLENHGVVTCGPDLISAYHHMETVEHFARVMITAEALGGPRLLTHTEVQKLKVILPGTQNLRSGRQIEVLAGANIRKRFETTQEFELFAAGSESRPGRQEPWEPR